MGVRATRLAHLVHDQVGGQEAGVAIKDVLDDVLQGRHLGQCVGREYGGKGLGPIAQVLHDLSHALVVESGAVFGCQRGLYQANALDPIVLVLVHHLLAVENIVDEQHRRENGFLDQVGEGVQEGLHFTEIGHDGSGFEVDP